LLLSLAAASGIATTPCPASPRTTVLVAHAIYPEGPVWTGGRFYFVEYGGAGIRTWNGRAANGRATNGRAASGRDVAAFWTGEHCGPSGLIAYHGTHLLVACYDSNTLVEVDEHGKTVRSFDRDDTGKAFVGPNDFAADGRGGLYFSASGVYDVKAPITGAVLHLSPDGRIRELAGTIHYPNGLTVSPDGSALLVAEDLAGRILAFVINPDGTLGARSVWARLADLAPPTPREDAYNGPDGLKFGPDGNVYVAQNGSGRVLVVSPDRRLLRTINVPTPYVTNLNFGADGAGTLYITGVFDPWKAPYPGAVYRWTR
jgi:gluconolactonase